MTAMGNRRDRTLFGQGCPVEYIAIDGGGCYGCRPGCGCMVTTLLMQCCGCHILLT